MIELELPYPPSLNHHYRFIGNRVLLSHEGLAYREEVREIVKKTGMDPMREQLTAGIDLFTPDGRRRDDDNGAIVIAYSLKPLFDALENARVFKNDWQVKRLVAELCGIVPGGKAIVRIDRYERREGPGA